MKINPLDSNVFNLIGWKIPASYAPSRFVEDAPEDSGLYAFTHWDRKFHYHQIAYIGMSHNLKSRLKRSTHEVIQYLESKSIFPTIWFKPFPKDGLIDQETKFIRLFNPSYNIRQKKRSI